MSYTYCSDLTKLLKELQLLFMNLSIPSMQMYMVPGKDQQLRQLLGQYSPHYLPLLFVVENGALEKFLISTGFLQNQAINTVGEF